jgi:hypothetical protein
MATESATTIEDIFQLKGADRDAKAYAFLYAAFRRTEVSANPVRDALDCLIPFISPYTNQIAGKQITSAGIQSFLKDSFGFELPLYAIDQLIGALQQQGFVEYRKTVRAHFAVAHESKFDFVKSDIETEFDDIAAQLQAYAKGIGFPLDPPPSGSWGDALVKFLRVRTDKDGPKIVKVKNVLLDPTKIEMAVVGGFIDKLHTEEVDRFEKIVHIFMGVLIEDFIASITEIGKLNLEKPVSVFYDTAVLMRQLGCSGKMLRIATEELTRYLQDLGFRIYFFSGNEAEVAGIIDTIVYIKDTGKELEGETAAAIAIGEVTTSHLRMLQNAFPERLAVFNIFPAGSIEKSVQDNARYQIDEKGFSEYLRSAARDNGRAYNQQNSQNDASYLGAIMRLRRGLRSRDLADSGYVFVTANKFLTTTSRRYLIEQHAISGSTFPPIVAVGQIATIAWLLKDQTIPPEKAGRELLTNCFAAVKPDAEWFGFFREGMEQVTGSIDEYTKQGKNALTVQAARRIAQDESFGNSSIVRQLNMVEILSRAEQVQQEREAEIEAKAEEERRLAAEHLVAALEQSEKALADNARMAIIEKQDAVKLATEQARQELMTQLREDRNRTAYRRAELILTALRLLVLVALAVALVWTVIAQVLGNTSAAMIGLTCLLAVVNVAGFADLLKFHFMQTSIDRLTSWVAGFLGAQIK